MNTRHSPKSHGMLPSLLATLASLLLCSCVSLDSGLQAKKKDIEKKIMQTESTMVRMPQDMADFGGKDLLKARLANAKRSLHDLHEQLADINRQIDADRDATRFVNAQIAETAGFAGNAVYDHPKLSPGISTALNGPGAAITPVCNTPHGH